MINRNNYETYFIDHIDGKLSPDVESELMLFLETNPDLSAELEGLENASLLSSPEIFDAKHLLKKQELALNSAEIDLLLARKLEGDLSNEEILLSEKLIAEYPFVANAAKVFAKTKLTPEHISFPEKEKLFFPDNVDMSDAQMLLIAKVEGDLTLEQNEKLSTLLASDATLRDELNLYYKTRLNARQFVFDAKAGLKKKAGIVLPIRRIVYGATAVAAALMLWFYVGNESVPATLASKSVHSIQLPKSVIASSDGLNDELSAEEKNGTNPISHNDQSSNDFAHHSTSTENKSELNNTVQPVADARPVKHTLDKIVPLEFGAFVVNEPFAELALKPTPVMPYIHNQQPLPGASHQDEQFLTLGEFLTGKAKETLWGNNNYPEDKFALALAEKQFQKRAGHAAPALEYERKNTDEEKSFRLKFWNFEFERKRK